MHLNAAWHQHAILATVPAAHTTLHSLASTERQAEHETRPGRGICMNKKNELSKDCMLAETPRAQHASQRRGAGVARDFGSCQACRACEEFPTL